MKYEVKIEKYQYCGGTEFIDAEINLYISLCGQPLHHIVCRKCGSVVRSYVENPEMLLNKKDRRI